MIPHSYSLSMQGVDPGRQENKEARTPAKKNRRHLDSTAEEEDAVAGSRSSSHSPPLSMSPRHDMKVRQISQGVEDLSWRNMRAPRTQSEGEEEELGSPERIDQGEVNIDAMTAIPMPPGPSETQIEGTQPDSTTSSQDPGMEVHHGNSLTSFIDSSNDPPCGLDSESDAAEKDKGLKRKLADRAVSAGPQDHTTVNSTIGLEPLKRPRDDADRDDNPRETKRPSPPPETEAESSKGISSFKLVCNLYFPELI